MLDLCADLDLTNLNWSKVDFQDTFFNFFISIFYFNSATNKKTYILVMVWQKKKKDEATIRLTLHMRKVEIKGRWGEWCMVATPYMNFCRTKPGIFILPLARKFLVMLFYKFSGKHLQKTAIFSILSEKHRVFSCTIILYINFNNPFFIKVSKNILLKLMFLLNC